MKSTKQNLVYTFSTLNSFEERCNWLVEYVHTVYSAKKIVLFFHSEHRTRYTIRKFSGLKKSALIRFESYRVPFIRYHRDPKNFGLYRGNLLLEQWPWFKTDMIRDLQKEGFTQILPFWSGSECLGGIVFKMGSISSPKKAKVFEEAATDCALLLEISFVQELLKRNEWEKRVVLDVGRKISELEELNRVLNVIIDSIHEVIPYDAAGIFLLKMPSKTLVHTAVRGFSKKSQEKLALKVGYGVVGWAIEHGEEVIVPDVRKDARYCMARKGTRSELAIPIKYGSRVMGAFTLEKDRINFFRHHHVELMRTFAAQTAIVLENSELLRQTVIGARWKEDMEIAERIQKALLPRKVPEVDGYDCAAFHESSFAVGGDLYDFFSLKENELDIAIGDVSGKGVPGALLMASLYATFRGLIRRSERTSVVIRDLNMSLYRQTEADKFATFFYGIVNSRKNTFCYTNAGHNPPIHFHDDGSWERLQKGGPLLGVVPGGEYIAGTVFLRPGDILFLYTDGVSEAFNSQEKEFGEKRIVAALNAYKNLPAEEISKKILEDIKSFSHKSHHDDDVTMLIVKKV